MNRRIKALQASALPLGHVAILNTRNKKSQYVRWLENINGADEGTRTLDIHLGKVVLYQLSYIRAQ